MKRDMEKRIGALENQIILMANAINELQSRLELLQRTLTNASNDVKPLSVRVSNSVNSQTPSDEETPLQDVLIQTLNVILNNPDQWVTSERVSAITGRSKNLESSYLHKLSEMNILRRKRIGRKVYYTVAKKFSSEV
jgi:uncharacterized coiled-coil protein SlyX